MEVRITISDVVGGSSEAVTSVEGGGRSSSDAGFRTQTPPAQGGSQPMLYPPLKLESTVACESTTG